MSSNSPIKNDNNTHKSKPARVSIDNQFNLWHPRNMNISGISQEEQKAPSFPSQSDTSGTSGETIENQNKLTKIVPKPDNNFIHKNQIKVFIEEEINRRLAEYRDNNSNIQSLTQQSTTDEHEENNGHEYVELQQNIHSTHHTQNNTIEEVNLQDPTQQTNNTSRATFNVDDNVGMDALLSQFDKPNDPKSTTKNNPRSDDYLPTDERLLPIGKTLESQLEAIRRPIEIISSKCLSDTKNIYAKNKVIQLWKEPSTPPPPENDDLYDATETTIPEEFFIPKYLQLEKIQLSFKQNLLECEDLQDQINNLKHRFELAKKKFKEEGSKCTKEIAILNKILAVRERCENIIKSFVTLTEYLCIFYCNQYPKSTKNNNLLAGCIMIHYIKQLNESFFEWLQEPKDKVIKLILKQINEQTENPEEYTNNPIIGQEKHIAEKIIESFLIPIFILSTKGLSELHQNKMSIKDENKELKKIIKTNELEKITSATKEGLDNIDLNDIDKKLIEILDKRESKLEAKITKLLTAKNQNRMLKNTPGPRQNGQTEKAKQKGKKAGIVIIKKPQKTKYTTTRQRYIRSGKHGNQLRKSSPRQKQNPQKNKNLNKKRKNDDPDAMKRDTRKGKWKNKKRSTNVN